MALWLATIEPGAGVVIPYNPHPQPTHEQDFERQREGWEAWQPGENGTLVRCVGGLTERPPPPLVKL